MDFRSRANVVAKVARLAQAFGVIEAMDVFAVPGELPAAEAVVAHAAHVLGVVLAVCVRAGAHSVDPAGL